MGIKNLFRKDIYRHIDGVVKASDSDVLRNELEEFVITDEIRSNLESFFENYNDGNTNGAWVSGFFGSGKSHLLKILAAVIENRDVGGRKAADIFICHCQGREDCTMLKGLVERAIRIPSRSILFNIGQQAGASGNSERKDTILPAFLQVFNASCGYCEQKLDVAQFERELDEEPGMLAAFETKFSELTGKDWRTKGRLFVTRYGAKIDQAYSAVTGSSATDVMGRYFNRDFSVMDFSRLVKAYIDRQTPGFRLNFFVDEVGQFVANNTPLMLMLQSIAEALNTTCRNASWLVVTSQTDISQVVGEMGDSQGNDFSRIIGRFNTKIQLSSKNVGDVIRSRLLEKDSSTIPNVASVYERFSGDLASIYDFADGMRKYRSYADCGDFVDLYPFVPYQFDLYHSALIQLSNRDAFTGRQQAVGERSMLEVCQLALKNLDATGDFGNMVPFDMWYDGIAPVIKPNIKSQIGVAESQLPHLSRDRKRLAIRLLKVLLLVKYVRGDFVASPRNLCSLLIEDLSINFARLLDDVKEVLGVLENESYVQRVGENYEYLTDSEKDLDCEIKHVAIDQSEVTSMLSGIFFSGIVRGRRMTAVNGQSYPFTQMLDGVAVGRPDGDLSVNFITPLNQDAANLPTIKQRSFGKDELTVVLKPDPAIFADIQNYLKTKKYLSQNPPMGQSDPARRHLLESRQTHNGAILTRVDNAIKEQVRTAIVLVRGEEVSVRSSDSSDCVIEGFSNLASKVYAHYGMVEGFSGLSEADVPRFLRSDSELPGCGVESEAEREIFSTISLNSSVGVTNTMKALVDKFEGKPYGWPLVVVECLVAKLLARGRLEATQGGDALDQSQLAAALRNTRAHDSLVLQPQTEITPQQIRKLKDFARDFFSAPIPGNEAKQVAIAVHDRLSAALSEWRGILASSGEMPFVASLEPVASSLGAIVSRPAMSLYSPEVAEKFEGLLDDKDSVVDAILGIAKGPQRERFLEARGFARSEESNFRRMLEWGGAWADAATKFQELSTLVDSTDLFRNGGMVRVSALVRELKTDLASAIERARKEASARIDARNADIASMPEFAGASEEVRAGVASAVADARAAASRESQISSVLDAADRFVGPICIELMNKVVASARPPVPPQDGVPQDGSDSTPVVVAYSEIANGYPGRLLATDADVDDYVGFLCRKLKTAIADGRRIAL